jgi:hypothetical protein
MRILVVSLVSTDCSICREVIEGVLRVWLSTKIQQGLRLAVATVFSDLPDFAHDCWQKIVGDGEFE